jgi:hypothetical protein
MQRVVNAATICGAVHEGTWNKERIDQSMDASQPSKEALIKNAGMQLLPEHLKTVRYVMKQKFYSLIFPTLTISRIASMLLSTAFFAIYHLISI